MRLGRWDLMWIFLSLPRGLVGHFVPTADPSIIADELDIIEAIGKSEMKNLKLWRKLFENHVFFYLLIF
jgi:hypothetical protein